MIGIHLNTLFDFLRLLFPPLHLKFITRSYRITNMNIFFLHFISFFWLLYALFCIFCLKVWFKLIVATTHLLIFYPILDTPLKLSIFSVVSLLFVDIPGFNFWGIGSFGSFKGNSIKWWFLCLTLFYLLIM